MEATSTWPQRHLWLSLLLSLLISNGIECGCCTNDGGSGVGLYESLVAVADGAVGVARH